MKIKTVSVLFLGFFIIFSSCKKGDKDQTAPPQQIKVIKIKPQNVPIYKEFVGQIYGNKDIPIRARVEGYLEKIHFAEGGHVNKGQLLYTIDSKPFQEAVAAEKSRVAEAQTMLIQSESDLKRIIPLVKMDAVSKRELDMAKAKRDAARSTLEAAKANLNLAEINLGYTKIYAPISGVIGNTLAEEGEFVGKQPNPVILNTVSDIDRIKVQFFLSEKEFLRVGRERLRMIRDGKDGGNVEIQLILADGSIFDQKGKLDFIDRSVDPTTGSIMLQASFKNPDGLLRPGQFARLKIKVREMKNALLVPQRSTTELQGKYSVFVVDKNNVVNSKIIEIQGKTGEFYIVKDGVKAGDQIVLEDVQKVKTGMEIVPELVEFDGIESNNE